MNGLLFQPYMREDEILTFLRNIPCEGPPKNLLLMYLEYLIESRHELNAAESIALANECALIGDMKNIVAVMPEFLECVEAVGDLVYPFDLELAASIYIKGHVYDKAIDCFVDMGRFQTVHMMARIINYPLSLLEVLRRAKSRNRKRAIEYAHELIRHYPHTRIDIESLFHDEPDFHD